MQRIHSLIFIDFYIKTLSPVVTLLTVCALAALSGGNM